MRAASKAQKLVERKVDQMVACWVWTMVVQMAEKRAGLKADHLA